MEYYDVYQNKRLLDECMFFDEPLTKENIFSILSEYQLLPRGRKDAFSLTEEPNVFRISRERDGFLLMLRRRYIKQQGGSRYGYVRM